MAKVRGLNRSHKLRRRFGYIRLKITKSKVKSHSAHLRSHAVKESQHGAAQAQITNWNLPLGPEPVKEIQKPKLREFAGSKIREVKFWY